MMEDFIPEELGIVLEEKEERKVKQRNCFEYKNRGTMGFDIIEEE